MEGGQTLKNVLAIWKDAAEAYTEGNYEVCIEKFLQVEELSARMLYNMACAYIRLDKSTLAVQCLSAAVKKDKHLAIAFFQKGILNLKQKSFKVAIEDLSQARALMRGNNFIDYKPLGMYTKLTKFEILYNLALAYLHDNHTSEAECLFTEALHDADIRQRKLLISALEHIQAKRPSLIKPVELITMNIFTPPKSVVENLEKKNVMASAKVVSATDRHDVDPSFNGMKRVQELKRNPLYSPNLRRSPLLKVKQFLLRRPRMKTAGSMQDLASFGAMRTAHSTGDIQNVPTRNRTPSDELSHSLTAGGLRILHSRSFDDTFYMSDSSTSSTEDVRSCSPTSSARLKMVHHGSVDETGKTTLASTRQTSLEEAYSTSASCIARALSSNYDVTIVVTPPASDSKEFPQAGLQNTDVTISQTNSVDINRNTVANDSTLDEVELNNNINANDVGNVVLRSTSPSSGRKSRPPPPSYPPPPLPSKVIFNL